MLDNWLYPVAIDEHFDRLKSVSKNQFGKRISIYCDHIPDLGKTKIALIGVHTAAANAVRKALYQLHYPFNALPIADLGNIRRNSIEFISPLINELLKGNILPILIGSDPGYTQAQYLAYLPEKDWLNLTVVDQKIRFEPTPTEDGFLNEIIHHDKQNLFNLCFLAFQSHFTPRSTLDWLDDHYFNYARLGNFRPSVEAVEPFIRNADLMSFHLSALRYAEASAQLDASPSGLFIEEACQVSRYAGLSDKLSSIGFYGYDPGKDDNGQSAQVMALLIWYFIYGYSQRKEDYPVNTDGLVEYVVDFKGKETQLTFWKSTKSGRWWMQVPLKVKDQRQRHRLVPCTYNDYQQACQQQISDRLFQAYHRFS